MGLMVELKAERIVTEDGTVIPVTTISDIKNQVFVIQSDRGKEISAIKNLVFDAILLGMSPFFDKENQYILEGKELYTRIFAMPFFINTQELVNRELKENGKIHIYLDYENEWSYIMREFCDFLEKEYKQE